MSAGLSCREGLGRSWALHEGDPVRLFALAGLVAKQGLVIGEGQQLADQHLGFVPFEDQDSLGLQHAEALGEALADVLPPVAGQQSILGAHPAIDSGPG